VTKDIDARRPPLVDSAYAALRQAILANDVPPGHQFSAQELATRLGMSRTPVQEAALKLQQEGLVEILPKRGIRVLAVSPGDLAEIYDVLIALEAAAAAGVAGRPPDLRLAAADALDDATDRMESAAAQGDLGGWGEADAAFHAGLVELSGNRRLATIVATVAAQAHRARMLTLRLRGDLTPSAREHRAIVRAIRAGDGKAAAAAAQAHRRNARDILLPLLERAGLRHL
jgi:DNA-binding GntR family transcriptional regulator